MAHIWNDFAQLRISTVMNKVQAAAASISPRQMGNRSLYLASQSRFCFVTLTRALHSMAEVRRRVIPINLRIDLAGKEDSTGLEVGGKPVARVRSYRPHLPTSSSRSRHSRSASD